MKTLLTVSLRVIPFLLVASVATAQDCAITNLALGEFDYHQPDSLFYSQPVVVTYSNPPATGVLVVYAEGTNWVVSRTSSITGSPQEVVLNGLPADGFHVTVTARFSDDYFCTNTAGEMVYTAPGGAPPSEGEPPTDVGPAHEADGYQLSFSPMLHDESTRIQYSVPQAGSVHLNVYSATGRLVKTLVDGFVPSGTHEVVWSGRDQQGTQVSSGVYFAVLRAGTAQTSLRLVLLR